MADLFGLYLQGGLVDVALLGGAQIDRYGNLNTTVIGTYTDPKVRLPGSGGACEIAINASRIYIIMHLKKRAFVEKLDFLTSPGHLHGGTTAQQLGIPGKGPQLVITDKALFDFANAEREMQLVSLYPGLTIEAISAEMGWKVRVAQSLTETPAPTVDELAMVRRLSSGGTSQRAGEA